MKYFSDEQMGKIRLGYYSAVYFNRTKEILLKEKNFKTVTMQVFQKKEGSVLCGIEEFKELLKEGAGYLDKDKWVDKSREIEIDCLSDGDRLEPWETIMHIKGPYVYFAHLESIYLGILARRTMVATNTKDCVDVAGEIPVIFFGDRFDYFLNQEGDGYAAKIGGAAAVCTEAMTNWTGEEAVGTIPHAMIAVNDGQIEKAAELFNKYYLDVNLIALVDFDNDCVGTSLKTARQLGKRLWGVRLDTAQEHGGVTPELVRGVRDALDREGFGDVKIVVSGGFYPEKIKKFTKLKVPVDAYGVGSSIIHGENDFTADVVVVEGKPMAKIGRKFIKILRKGH